MPNRKLVAALALLTAAPALWGCQGYMTKEEYDRNIHTLEKANASLVRRNAELEPMGAENERLKAELARGKSIEELSAEIRKAIDEISKASGGVLIQKPGGGYELTADAFDPGLYTVKPAAKKALTSLAQTLKDKKGTGVRIVGHTDSDSIKKNLDKNPTGMNAELGANRAVAVADVLHKNGIDEKRMYLESAGASMPVASNSNDAGKKKNRRVDIYLFTVGK